MSAPMKKRTVEKVDSKRDEESDSSSDESSGEEDDYKEAEVIYKMFCCIQLLSPHDVFCDISLKSLY